MVMGPDFSADKTGIQCINAAQTAYQNLVAGFATGVAGCLQSGNVVNLE